MSKLKEKYNKLMELAKEAEKPMRAVKVKNIGEVSDSLLPALQEIKTSLEKLDLNVDFKEVTTAIENLKKSMDSMEMNPTFKPEFKPTFKVENKMEYFKEVLSALEEVRTAIVSIKLPNHSEELSAIKDSIDALPPFPDVVKSGRIKVEVDRVGEFHSAPPFENSSGQSRKAKVDADGNLQVAVVSEYKITDIDGDYFGFTDKDGGWYIMYNNGSTYRYLRGDSGYISAWTNRVGADYDYYFNIF